LPCADSGYGGEVGNYKISAGAGNDTVNRGYSLTGTFNASGGAGIDKLQLSLNQEADPLVFKMSNNINLKGGMIKATGFEVIWLSSGNGNDKLMGGAFDDTLDGGGGNHKLLGLNGNDYMGGGSGVDSLYGGEGNDTLNSGNYGLSEYGEVFYGGDGNDLINALHGATVNGGKGTDYLNLNLSDQSGNFVLNVNKAVNKLDATTKIVGIEQLNFSGGSGIDKVTGGALNDVINGYGGNDVIHGGVGSDQLSDGMGNDKIFGDAGDDFLSRTDNTGRDSFYGGDGYDTFTFASYAISAQLDLLAPGNNAGQAAGLKLFGIEKIIGSYADDARRGGNSPRLFVPGNRPSLHHSHGLPSL
jgi:Ca2+-binding RTX toxin-like protein